MNDEPKKFRCYGFIFSVTQTLSGLYELSGVPEIRGRADYVLDRMGRFETADAAEAALEKWARRVHATPIVPAVAKSPGGYRQGDLFASRQ